MDRSKSTEHKKESVSNMGNTARTSNLTICFWVEQRDIIERAAQAKGWTLSDWIRKRVMPIAAQELGIPLPRFPEFGKRGGSDSGVYRAASALGMTVKQFEKNAAKQVAEALLDAVTAPVAPVSETWPAPTPVGFSETGERRR